MRVDIIIPTYKPDDTFCLLLQKLQEQTFVIHELILVNTEETLWNDAIRKYPIEQIRKELPFPSRIFHMTRENFDHGGARNTGVGYSGADILIFMTQDAVPADDRLVEHLVHALTSGASGLGTPAKGAVAVAYARQLPREDCGIIERYTRQFNYPKEGCVKSSEDIPRLGIKTFFCSDVCAAYRRDLFEQLGRFESPVIFNEDMFFAAHAVQEGYKVAYAADAEVVHSHNYSVKQQFHRNFDLAVSQTVHPEIFEQVSSEAAGMRLVKNTMGYL